MADKLKIYACSGIGSTDGAKYTYWTDNTNTVENTQAVNQLLVGINSIYTQITYLRNISKEEKISGLNQIDMLSVCLDAFKRYKDDEEKLLNAGKAISIMVVDGDFESELLDNDARDSHLDELLDKAKDLYDEDGLQFADNEFEEYWRGLMAYNRVGLSKDEQKITISTIKKAASNVKKIGAADDSWKDNDDISKYLNNAGRYFLYLYFTDAQIAKLPDIFRKRRQYQERIYNYCKSYFVGLYGTEDDMREVIRMGIIKDTGDEPENICAAIASGKQKGVGIVWTTQLILGLVMAGVALIVGIVQAICNAVYKSNTAKYAAMNNAIIEGGAPNESDCDGLNIGGNTAISQKNNNWLWIAAAGAAALLLLKK